MIEVFTTILVVIAVILVVVAITLVMVASIGVVIALFAKNKGQEFEIFFKQSKKGILFLVLADFLTCTISQCFKFYKCVVLLQISCPRFYKIIFKDEAISVGHRVFGLTQSLRLKPSHLNFS